MAKQEESRGPIQQDFPGKACPFCGGKTYQLAVGSIRRLDDSILFIRCRRCNHPRSFDAEFKRLLWMNSKTRVWEMLLTISETLRRPFHHLQAYIDQRQEKRSTLQMLAISGAVRPSHVELRFTTPLLAVEGSHHSHQEAPQPPTNQSSLLMQSMEFMRQLVMDLRSLRPYVDRGLSSLGVELGVQSHSLSGLPSTTAVAITEQNSHAAKAETVNQEIIGARAACDHELMQLVTQSVLAPLQQIAEEERNTTPLSGDQHEHRSHVALVDLPVMSPQNHESPQSTSMMSGTVTVLRPRIVDLAQRFERKVLPLLTRRPREVGRIPSGPDAQRLATEDFDGALQNLLGEGAPLPASSIQRLKMFFQLEYDAWRKRDLSHLAVAYWWADGLYVKAGIEDHKSALLTIVGVLTTGEKVVLACESGHRESKTSWLKLLRDLTHRGLTFPRLTVADSRLGLWAALDEIHPSSEQQGCWNRKIATVLKTLPKEARLKVRELLKAMAYAETQAECERRRDRFVRTYRKTEEKAVKALLRDWERMITFYRFPQDHWRYIRTTNIVVSPFNSVQLRTTASRHYKRVEGAKAIMWKMLQVAEKSWKRLHAPELLPLVSANMTFKDGVLTESKTFANNSVNQQSEKTAA